MIRYSKRATSELSSEILCTSDYTTLDKDLADDFQFVWKQEIPSELREVNNKDDDA